MPNRQEHQQDVVDFLKEHLSIFDWKVSLPHGSGQESYIVHGFKRSFFVKVNVPVERYLTIADLGLTPPVFVHGILKGGQTVIVQPFVEGREPSRADYRDRLSDVAEIVRTIHTHPRMQEILPTADSSSYKDAGLQALNRLWKKWDIYKVQVPDTAGFVGQSLELLATQIEKFSGDGLVASHGDICNANWLFSLDGKIFLLDLDSMLMDDPALDLGALLWWYYPPELRKEFLEIAGYQYDEEFKFRMQTRMAMHCLDITLPRTQSFDRFHPDTYQEALTDFRAILTGMENPQGYED